MEAGTVLPSWGELFGPPGAGKVSRVHRTLLPFLWHIPTSIRGRLLGNR